MALNKHYYGSMQDRYLLNVLFSLTVNYVTVKKKKYFPAFCIKTEACSAHNTIINGISTNIFV